MKKPVKLLIILGCVAGLSLWLFSCGRHYLKQDRIVRLAEHQLEQTFRQPAHIGATRLELLKGPRLTFYDVTIGQPGQLFIRARYVRIKLRPGPLLVGRVVLSRIDLVKPQVWAPLEEIRKLSRSGGGHQPRIRLIEGSLNLRWRGRSYGLSQAVGEFSRHRCDFDAALMGGRLEIRVLRMRKLWQGSLKLSGVAPELPLEYRHFLPLSIACEGHGSDKKAVLSSLNISSPSLSVNGSASLADLGADPRLSLELTSDVFDYQPLVDPLPIRGVFLKRLFKENIREGQGRLESLRLSGRLSELRDPRRLFGLLDLRLLLLGQSFGAGFDAERIRDIHGRMRIKDGDINFDGLNGRIGSSAIQRVDLVFDAPLAPGFRVATDVTADLAAADFVRAWRAAMDSPELHGAFAGFTRVSGGRVLGRVHTSYDSRRTLKPLQITGQLAFDQVSLIWQGLNFSRVSGRALAARPQDPVVFDLKGGFEGLQLNSSRIAVNEFRPGTAYSFAFDATRLPALGGLALDSQAGLQLRGQGRGARFSGQAALAAGRLAYGEAVIRPLKGRRLSAAGGFTGRLLPSFGVELGPTRISDSGLVLSGAFGSRSGRLRLAGPLELAGFDCAPIQNLRIIAGRIEPDLTIVWGGPDLVSGSLDLAQVKLRGRSQNLGLDGRLNLRPGRVATDNLRLRLPQATVTLKARLDQASRFLSGAASLRDLSLRAGQESASGLGLPAGYRARLDLDLADIDLYGLNMRRGTARLEGDGANLSLRDLRLGGENGSLAGSLRLDRQGAVSYNLDVSIKNADVGRLVANFKRQRPLARGRADLEGHFWGRGRAVNGSARFAIHDGKILRYGALAKVFGALNVYKIFKNGHLSIHEEGFPFNRFAGNFLLRANVASFDDLRLDSNSVQMSAVGSYDFDREVIDIILGLQPLETVDRTVGAIPVLGWILAGPESKLLVFSFRVKGPIDDPLVLPAPVETLSKPVIGALQRTLTLPVDLIRNPGKVLLPGGAEPPRQQPKRLLFKKAR